jgi:molecular chaperone IbpA
MNNFELDLTPLYRHSVGFDQLASMLRNSVSREAPASNYPPYNIEVEKEHHYQITIAVAGFSQEDLDIQVEDGVLLVRGKKSEDTEEKHYLYQGIAGRSFERKFNLADHTEVKGAELINGLLTIKLVKEIPEAMKPRRIEIGKTDNVIQHKAKDVA